MAARRKRSMDDEDKSMAGGSSFKRSRSMRVVARTELKRAMARVSEPKAVDLSQPLAGVPNTVTLGGLTNLVQGVTGITRIGDQVTSRSLFIRGTVRWNPAGDPSQIVRCAVIMDTEGNGAAPLANGSTSAIWEGAAGVLIVEAQLNHLTRKRYVMLWNEAFCLSAAQSAFYFVKSIRLGAVINYLDATAAATSIARNHCHFAFWSDKAVNTPTIAFVSRFRFTDM